MKDIYLYNYLKSYKTIERFYKENHLKKFYTAYLMIGKLTLAFIYPILKITDGLELHGKIGIPNGLIFLIIAIIFFSSDYFLVIRKFDEIVKRFDKKSENEIAQLRLFDYIIKFMIIALNLIFIFMIA